LLKFRALYQGDNVAEVFNLDWAGKTMDEVIPMSLRRVTLDAAKECVRSGCLVYTIVSTIDSNDRRVDCERLLLPFGRNGSGVEQILAFLQLRNMEGSARRGKILRSFELHADLVYSCRIQSGFTQAGSTLPSETENKRARAPRRNVLRAGRINFADGSATCTVRNISATGALIEVATATEIPKTFTLILEMETTERPCTVVWRKRTQIGVKFR